MRHLLVVYRQSVAADKRMWVAYIEEMRRYPDLEGEEELNEHFDNQIGTADLVKHHSETVDLHKDLLDFFGRSADALRKPVQART